MNKHSLTFKDQHFEVLFQSTFHENNYNNFKQICYHAIFVEAVSSLINIIQGNFLNGLILFLIIPLTLILLRLCKNSPATLNFSNFIIAISVNFILFIKYYGNQKNLTHDDIKYSDFYYGMVCSYFHIIALNGSKYYLKKMAIAINAFLTYFFFLAQDWDFQVYQRMILLISAYCLDHFIYQQEYDKRQFFLLMQKNSQWQQALENSLEIPVFQATYNWAKDQMKFFKGNLQAKINLEIINDIKFKYFCRQFQIQNAAQKHMQVKVQQEKKIQQQIIKQHRKQKQIMNLEKFIYFLIKKNKNLKKICKLQNLDSIYDTQFTLQGQFEEHFFQLKLFCLYDTEMNIIIMVEKEETCEKQLKIEAQEQIYEKVLQKIFLVNKVIQAKTLVGTKKILNDSQRIPQIKNTKQLTVVQYLQYVAYNNYVNIACFTNRCDYHNHNSTFKISEMIYCLRINLQPILKDKNIKVKLNFNDKIDQITNCYWKLYQILLNILINSSKYDKSNSSIVINYKIKKDLYFSHNLIIFGIFEETSGISQKQIDSLPIINPNYLWEYYINYKASILKLGLTVSSYLIGQIGPSARLLFKRQNSQHKIKFQIYQNAETLVKNKLVTKFKFQPQIILEDQRDWLF